MMSRYSLLLLLVFCLFTSCVNTKSAGDRGENTYRVRLLAGGNHGGITENTDMGVVPEVGEAVDAFTGATSVGWNAGVHVERPIGKNGICTGVDFMRSVQHFSYNDAVNGYAGTRKLSVSQVMIPLTYRISLFTRSLSSVRLALNVGFLGQYNLISCRDSGLLPEYSVKRWSKGLMLGISLLPIELPGKNRLGAYLDIYRGSRAYKDFYNRSDFEMPGTSFIKFGFIYQFNP